MAEDQTPPPAPEGEPAPPPRRPPRPPPPPERPHKRSPFSRRDELGLVVLALVLTVIVWTIARQSVVKEQAVLAGVKVVWKRAPDSDLDVVFAVANPTVDVPLTCSDPDYQEYRRKLRADGLRLQIGPLASAKNQRPLSAKEGDGYDLPFHPSLLAGRTLPLPAGSVVRVERGIVKLVPPDLGNLRREGIEVEVVEIEPNTFEVENVRANLFREAVQPDPVQVDDLRLDEPLGTAGTRWVVPRFTTWTGEDGPTPDAARVEARRRFPPVRIQLRVFGGERRTVKGLWRWVLSEADEQTYSFRVGGDRTSVGIEGPTVGSVLAGAKEQLDWIEANPDRWHFAIAVFGDERKKFPKAGDEDEQPVHGKLLFIHDDDPHFAGVRFEPTMKQRQDLTVLVKRTE